MNTENNQTASEAVEVVNEVVQEAKDEGFVQGLEVAAENAAERIDAATETAEMIAESAMATALGQRITELEGRIFEWVGQKDALESRVVALELALTVAQVSLSTLSAATTSQSEPTIISTADPNLSILPASPEMPTPDIMPEEVPPLTAKESDVVGHVEIRRKRKVRIL